MLIYILWCGVGGSFRVLNEVGNVGLYLVVWGRRIINFLNEVRIVDQYLVVWIK
jgi:hypothetical protein